MEPSRRRNLELKATYPDLSAARDLLRRMNVPLHEVQVQCDTYFAAAHGRLKLREIEPAGRAALISYQRPDATGVRGSQYYLVPVPDAATLKAALSAALGVRGQVHKRREIYLWHNVRIHLDEVRGLGSFIEFEAVMGEGEEEAASMRRLDELTQALAIDPARTLAPSYADLVGL